jgi:hypothetical protein
VIDEKLALSLKELRTEIDALCASVVQSAARRFAVTRVRIEAGSQALLPEGSLITPRPRVAIPPSTLIEERSAETQNLGGSIPLAVPPASDSVAEPAPVDMAAISGSGRIVTTKSSSVAPVKLRNDAVHSAAHQSVWSRCVGIATRLFRWH